jgi:hypothetical protein
MKISTQAKLISTALVAAAIAAPIAHGQSDGMLIYQASQKAAASSPSGYVPLKTSEGFSFKAPSYWSIAPTPTVHINRSLEVPARYLGSGETPAPTPINRSLEVPAQYLPPSGPLYTTASDGFDWQDAGIGAAFVAGLGILGCCGFLAVRRRHELAQLDV